MKIIDGYTPQYCDKCVQGFISVKQKSGEEVLVPCECKVKQDEIFLYGRLYQDSGIDAMVYQERTFENYQEWLPEVLKDYLNPRTYEDFYNQFLRKNGTKFVTLFGFIDWFFKANPRSQLLNVFVTNHLMPLSSSSSRGYYSFFINFLGYVLVKRLISVRVLTHTELMGLLMAEDRSFDINKFIGEFDVVFITGLFSDLMLENDLTNSFKYDRLVRFFYALYRSKDCCVFTFSDRGISHIRTLEDDKDLMSNRGNKFMVKRANALLDIILNKSQAALLFLEKAEEAIRRDGE